MTTPPAKTGGFVRSNPPQQRLLRLRMSQRPTLSPNGSVQADRSLVLRRFKSYTADFPPQPWNLKLLRSNAPRPVGQTLTADCANLMETQAQSTTLNCDFGSCAVCTQTFTKAPSLDDSGRNGCGLEQGFKGRHILGAIVVMDTAKDAPINLTEIIADPRRVK